jgi:hypothetical protein
VSEYWFSVTNVGIYKTDSTFATILASATTSAHFGLYFYSTSSTIHAVKSGSVIEYTTVLAVSYTNTISGCRLYSITGSGITIYIGTSVGLVFVMVNRAVTVVFAACNFKSNYVNSMVIQGTTMMTNCQKDINFYTGNGSSFSFLSAITYIGNNPLGVWVDLNNQLVVSEGESWVIMYYDNTISTTTVTTTTTRTVITLNTVRSFNSSSIYKHCNNYR